MSKQTLIKNLYSPIKKATLISLLTITTANSFEFDASLLNDIGMGEVDLSVFTGENDQFSGEYTFDYEINGKKTLRNITTHIYNDQLDEEVICFTPELINRLPLKEAVIKKLESKIIHTVDIGNCLGFNALDPAVEIVINKEWQQVNINLPHAFIDDLDPYWVPPRQRDDGISGIFLDYAINSSYSRSKYYGNTESHTTLTSYGVLGANLGKIRLRGNYQYDAKQKGSLDKFQWAQRYAFMDIGSLNSKLFIGEIYTQTHISESVRIKGVSLYSDPNMMPSYLQGYAPQVTGTVITNSTITLLQYGQVLKQIQVPPGPFVIADLSAYISGTIQVEIEQNGVLVQTYEVDITQVPFLTRKNAFQYSFNIGKLDSLNHQSNQPDQKLNSKIISADASYGLFNNLSVYTGTILTTNEDYRALSLGIGVNLSIFGALSFDVTESKNSANPDKTLKGQSYRFNYAKRFSQNSSLNIVGYRFSSRNYTTIHNYIDMKSGNTSNLSLEKNRVSLSFSQNIPAIDSTVSATLTKGTYWNRKSISNYAINYATTIKSGLFERSSLQMTLSRNTDYYNNAKDTQIGLFITIPLSLDNYDQMARYSAHYNNDREQLDQQVTYYDKAFGGDISMGINTNQKRDFTGSIDYLVNASYRRDTSYGSLWSYANYSADMQSISGSLDGSLTLTQHGLATHRKVTNNSARVILDTGVSGVEIVGNNIYSNSFGLAGISNAASYNHLNYKVNINNLPSDVEIQNSIVDIALTEGAIGYRSVDAIVGDKALVKISLPDGTNPPFGSVIYRENGVTTEIGMIAGNGQSYLIGINKKDQFVVKWSTGSCQFKTENVQPQNLEEITCYRN